MFVCVTGTPGSGKSAFGVDTILNKQDDYKNIYANINGLKMQGNIKPLNFRQLRNIIIECKRIYDLQIDQLGTSGSVNIIDQPILDYLLSIGFVEYNEAYTAYDLAIKERKSLVFYKRIFLNIVKSIPKVQKYKPNLFLVDEAQNHLPSIDPITGKAAAADPVLIWWVSYHRHLYMDVILLTQQHQKIHISYLRDVQYFLDAVDDDNTLLGKKSPHFKYIKHMASPYYKTNKAGSVKVKKSKALFAMYESGDAVRTKSVVLPYIIMALVMLAVTIGVFSYALSSLGSGEHDDLTVTSSVADSSLVSSSHLLRTYTKKPSPSMDSLSYIKLDCISDVCINSEYKINVNVDDLNATLSSTDSRILSVRSFSDFHASMSLLVTKEFTNLFQGSHNGKNNKSFNLLN